jgi:hypothetical protein
MDAYDGLTADEQRGISHGNAWALFPRLAAAVASREAVKPAIMIE